MSEAGNLKPNTRRTPEQLREMGAKGGKASGEARRRNKATRLLIRELLNSRPKASRAEMKRLEALGYDAAAQGAPTLQALIYSGLAEKARDGDIGCLEYLNRYAQIPDIRVQLERERMKAQAEARARVDVSFNPDEGESVMEEIRARMAAEAGEPEQAGEPEEVIRE